LAVEVDSRFSTLSYQKQLAELDTRLVSHIQQTNLFSTKKPLSPMPLLGIPDVWDANHDPAFYENTDYFRPKPSPKASSKSASKNNK
jgi:hypothetical protein